MRRRMKEKKNREKTSIHVLRSKPQTKMIFVTPEKVTKEMDNAENESSKSISEN